MLKTLFKSKLASIFYSFTYRNGKKRSVGMLIFTAIMLVYVLGFFAFMSFGIFSLFASSLVVNGAGGGDVFFTIAAILGFVTAVFGSTALAINQIYEAKDNDMLLSMPVKPSYILLSRMILLIIYDFLFTSLIQLPALVAYTVFAGFDALVFVRFLFFYIAGMLLSLSFTLLLAWLISALTSRFNIKKVLYIVFFLAFFAGYMLFYMNMQSIISGITDNIAAVGEALKKYSGPFYLGGAGVSGNWLYWVLFLLICVGVFVAAYALLSKSFIKIATSHLSVKKAVYREKALKSSSAGLALYKKEFKRLFTLPAYFINAGLGAILALILPIIVAFNVSNLSEVFSGFTAGSPAELAGMIIAVSTCFCCSMTSPTACCVSLEGKSFPLLYSFPVSGKTICYSKLLYNITLGCVPCLISLTAAIIIAKVPLTLAPFVLLLPLAVQVFAAYLGLIANLKRPNFEWTSVIIPIKQDLPMMVAVLGGMLIMTVVLVPGVFIALAATPLIGLSCACIPYVIAILVMALYLDKKAEKLLADCANR